MGRGEGRGGGGHGKGSAGRGKGGRKSRDLANPSRRTGETGACEALESHIITISSGNKARDGDTLVLLKKRW